MSNRYLIYPSLLDAYNWMQQADDEEQRQQRRQELLDKLNRQPYEPSPLASRGTALNLLIDRLVAGQYIKPEPCGKNKEGIDMEGYKSRADGVDFCFEKYLVMALAGDLRGSVCQPYLEADLKTDHGLVHLYGYGDYIQGDAITDLKTTSRYNVGKYREHFQHLVYPYCAVKGGYIERFDHFTYLVAEVSTDRSGLTNGLISKETYNPTIEECERRLREFLDSQFLPFLEDNRHLITDRRVFGG